MIGFFSVIDTRDASTYCIAASDVNSELTAKVFIPPLYRDSIKRLNTGDKVFCVVDDASGFGAILFKQDDGLDSDNALNIDNDLNVGRNITARGNIDASGTLSGSSPNTNMSLTAAHTAMILASALSGSPAELPAVNVRMDNV